MVHRAERDFRSGGKAPLPLHGVVRGDAKRAVERVRPVDQFRKLRHRLSKQQRAVVRNVDLPQRLN